jgi:V8-like Glu-specific endopeptidase
MNRWLPRLSSLNLSLLLFILVFIAVAGSPDAAVVTAAPANNPEIKLSQQSGKPGVISAQESSVDWLPNQQPWTKARMQAAQPYPLPSYDLNSSVLNDVPEPSGDPITIPSVPPKGSSPAFQVEEDLATSSGVGIPVYSYPAPFTRYENFDDYTIFPYSTIGVLFFSQNGIDFRCSAASIGDNALWTAGHCVHDGKSGEDGWSDNIVFVPAYKDGNAPFGSWSFIDVVTSDAWFTSGDSRFDMGGAILEPNASGATVDEVVGSLGFAYNLNPMQHWFNLGYPVDTPFDGKTMQLCSASFVKHDAIYGFPMPMAMGCDLTDGSDGGPWIINFSGSPGNTNYINGNNSYRYIGFGEEMYSPYFGDAAKELLASLSSETRILTNYHLPIIISTD